MDKYHSQEYRWGRKLSIYLNRNLHWHSVSYRSTICNEHWGSMGCLWVSRCNSRCSDTAWKPKWFNTEFFESQFLSQCIAATAEVSSSTQTWAPLLLIWGKGSHSLRISSTQEFTSSLLCRACLFLFNHWRRKEGGVNIGWGLLTYLLRRGFSCLCDVWQSNTLKL